MGMSNKERLNICGLLGPQNSVTGCIEKDLSHDDTWENTWNLKMMAMPLCRSLAAAGDGVEKSPCTFHDSLA